MPRSGRDLAILDMVAWIHPIGDGSLSRASGERRLLTGSRARSRFPAVSHTVWALGWTSLLTDVSSEMVASVLPLYLVLHLGMSPLAFGVVDGLYPGRRRSCASRRGFCRIAGGRYKAIAVPGMRCRPPAAF